MKRIVILLAVTVLTVLSAKAQEVSCTDLMDYVKENGYRKGSVTSFQLLESSWLKEVEAYSIENMIVVIAEIKRDEWGFNTKEYVFCGIPSANWDAFYTGLYDRDKTFGERFRKYIFEYKCNCN